MVERELAYSAFKFASFDVTKDTPKSYRISNISQSLASRDRFKIGSRSVRDRSEIGWGWVWERFGSLIVKIQSSSETYTCKFPRSK